MENDMDEAIPLLLFDYRPYRSECAGSEQPCPNQDFWAGTRRTTGSRYLASGPYDGARPGASPRFLGGALSDRIHTSCNSAAELIFPSTFL